MKLLLICLALLIGSIGAVFGACGEEWACPAVYDPVCAMKMINGKPVFRIFSNSCELGIRIKCGEGWKLISQGECKKLP